MEYKVSIIVPVYNIENYIEGCIKSLINQTYQNIEILLINDGSKDKSFEKCELYSQLDKRIKVISKENGGLSSARNCGLENVTGEYILFVDGDDQINKHTVEILMHTCCEHNFKVDFIQFKYKEIYNLEEMNDEKAAISNKFKLVTNKEVMFEKLYLLGGEAVSACTKLYKKNLFDNLRFKEGILHEDEYIITDILDRSTNCIYMDASLYYYIMRDGSIIRSNYTSRKKDIFLSIDKRIKYFEEKKYNSLLDRELSRYFIILVIMYTNAIKEKYYEDSTEIKNRLKALLKKTNSINVNSNMKLLFRLFKFNISFLEIYTALKNMRK